MKPVFNHILVLVFFSIIIFSFAQPSLVLAAENSAEGSIADLEKNFEPLAEIFQLGLELDSEIKAVQKDLANKFKQYKGDPDVALGLVGGISSSTPFQWIAMSEEEKEEQAFCFHPKFRPKVPWLNPGKSLVPSLRKFMPNTVYMSSYSNESWNKSYFLNSDHERCKVYIVEDKLRQDELAQKIISFHLYRTEITIGYSPKMPLVRRHLNYQRFVNAKVEKLTKSIRLTLDHLQSISSDMDQPRLIRSVALSLHTLTQSKLENIADINEIRFVAAYNGELFTLKNTSVPFFREYRAQKYRDSLAILGLKTAEHIYLTGGDLTFGTDFNIQVEVDNLKTEVNVIMDMLNQINTNQQNFNDRLTEQENRGLGKLGQTAFWIVAPPIAWQYLTRGR